MAQNGEVQPAVPHARRQTTAAPACGRKIMPRKIAYWRERPMSGGAVRRKRVRGPQCRSFDTGLRGLRAEGLVSLSPGAGSVADHVKRRRGVRPLANRRDAVPLCGPWPIGFHPVPSMASLLSLWTLRQRSQLACHSWLVAVGLPRLIKSDLSGAFAADGTDGGDGTGTFRGQGTGDSPDSLRTGTTGAGSVETGLSRKALMAVVREPELSGGPALRDSQDGQGSCPKWALT